MNDLTATIGDAQAARQAETEARLERQRMDLDQRAADMRVAALLNALAVAKAHGMSPEWTEGDVERLRNMMGMTDEIATGANDAESVPQGFGPAARARQTKALLKAARPVDGDAEGGQT